MSASPRNLEMQILRPYFGSFKSETLGIGPRYQCFKSLQVILMYLPKFKNYCLKMWSCFIQPSVSIH